MTSQAPSLPPISNPLNRQANAYLAAIVESSDDAIISKNLDGTITSWNAAAVKMYGYTAEEIVGKHISLIIPRDRIDEEAHIISRLKLGEKIDHFETIRQSKDGTQLEVSITVSPIRDASGYIIGASKIARDISSRRAMERELEKHAYLLAEKDRTKDEFLAMLAHELRNPLAPISNALHIINVASVNPERQKDAMALASRQVTHMVRLLDDLLDVSRITHGKIVMRNEQVNLYDILRNAIDGARPFVEGRHHQLHTDLPLHPVWLKGDATRLAQLFGNLLHNAAKYTNDGGIISVACKQQDNNATVHVHDNGIGIEPGQQPMVFDMFMQVDNSMQRKQGGLGIGLTLVKNIAELHGGSVAVASEGLNKGTEFSVTLPMSADADAPSPHEKPAATTKSHRILVVDDNEASAKTLGWMLEALGHEVQVAYNAATALHITETFLPDVALLDIGMPHMNGYELCKYLRTNDKLKHTVFIAQTGWGQKQDLQRSKESGFDFHLIKPISIETLQKKLDSIEPAA